jgi:oligopeptide transport system permease protein
MSNVAKGGSASKSILKQRTLLGDAVRRFSRNKLALLGLAIVVFLVVLALGAQWIAAEPYDEAHFDRAWLFPNAQNVFGTDALGRDFLSRIIYGARISLLVGFVSQGLSYVIGVPLGLFAGWRGGRTDYAIMRVVDAMSAFPRLLFAILIMSVLGAGLDKVLFALALTGWIDGCRMSRAQILQLKDADYVTAARAIGARDRRLLFNHLLPNSLSPLIVGLGLGIPGAIFGEAGLSFLGLGINPPIPSWGQMLGEAGKYAGFYWYLGLFPAIAIALTMLGFTLFGDGLRDALDPRMSQTK